jgi:HAD superfamily hydrolase (TIGR01509 family)
VTGIPAGRRPIRAVIFDIGGILERPFEHVLFPELSRTLGVPESRLRERRAADAIPLTEGRLTLREFYARIAREDARPVEAEVVVARHLSVYAAATMPLDERVLSLIDELRRRHIVACLTNTEVEVGRFNRERGLYRLFDRAFLSTELGLRKPDPAIFERVLAELHCAPDEAVFTDDNLENAAGARATRMHAIHYRGFEGFAKELAGLVDGRG